MVEEGPWILIGGAAAAAASVLFPLYLMIRGCCAREIWELEKSGPVHAGKGWGQLKKTFVWLKSFRSMKPPRQVEVRFTRIS